MQNYSPVVTLLMQRASKRVSSHLAVMESAKPYGWPKPMAVPARRTRIPARRPTTGALAPRQTTIRAPAARRNPAIIGALIAGALAVVASLPTAAATVTAAVISSGNSQTLDCLAVVERYSHYVGSSSQRVDILTTPDAHGRSPLSADRAATSCGVSKDGLMEMIKDSRASTSGAGSSGETPK
jgi:hypothetical protein